MKFSAVLLFMVLWFTFALPADRAHGLVLARPGCVHGGDVVDATNAKAG